MDAIYMGEKQRVARVGNVVMVPGNVRGIVIEVKGTFVKFLGIGTKKDTGDTFVLQSPFVHDFTASECSYMEKQLLNL